MFYLWEKEAGIKDLCQRASGHVQRARPYKPAAPPPGLSHPSLPTFACGGRRPHQQAGICFKADESKAGGS